MARCRNCHVTTTTLRGSSRATGCGANESVRLGRAPTGGGQRPGPAVPRAVALITTAGFWATCAAVAQPGRAAVSYVQAKTPAPKELQVGGSKPSGGSSSQTCRCSCKRQIRKLQVRGSNPCGGFRLWAPQVDERLGTPGSSWPFTSALGAARTHRCGPAGCTRWGTACTPRD